MNPAGNELTKTLEEGCSLAIISSRLFLPVSIELSSDAAVAKGTVRRYLPLRSLS